MLPPGTFILKNHIFYHSYADDTQMHVLFSSDDLTSFQKLISCTDDINSWMSD